jgi:hypothetical protein
MAYVPKCVYDVFLSYAHVDNLPAVGDRWVDRFKKQLEAELRAELAVCLGEQRFVVWQDVERLKPGFSLSQSIREALGKTAVVISLYSPGYIGSGYCADERASFEQQCGDRLRLGTSSRLINVIIRSSQDVVRLASVDLFAKLFNTAGPLAIGSDAFHAEFASLVQAVKSLLEGMRQQFPKVYVALGGASGDPELVTFITKTTANLLEELSQAGYARTTEIHPGFYSDQQLEQEIGEAMLSIHPVTDPSDLLTRRQIEAACRTGVPVLVWLAPSALGPDSAWIRKTVPGPRREYSTCAFSTFCERVKRVLGDTAGKGVGAPRPNKRKTVFLLRNSRVAADKQGADSVRRRLESRGVDVTFEVQDWDALDGVLVYQREADNRWFETKLKFVATAPVVRAACTLPPPDKSWALQAAHDYDFRSLSAFDRLDPRLLLEGDDSQHLQPFLEAVLAR